MSIKVNVDVKINPRTKDIVEKGIVDGLFKSAIIVENQAKMDCPVDTSQLVSSIRHDVDTENFTADISANTDYAVYVEFADGTVFARKEPKKKGKIPFMRPALFDNRDKIINIMNKEMRNVLK